MTTPDLPVGWVLRAATTGFAFGCRVMAPNTPNFGDFVQVPVGETHVIGLIYDVRINDDASVRQLILADTLDDEAILDQRENRLVPIEVSVLSVGYRRGRSYIQNLPPQPPVSLDALRRCTAREVVPFTENLEYLRLVLSASHVPGDDLVMASLMQAAEYRAPEVRRAFLLRAGRELGRHLSRDLVRLESILRQIRLVLAD